MPRIHAAKEPLKAICSIASLCIFFLIVGNCKIDMLRSPPNTIPEPINGIMTAEIKRIHIIEACEDDRIRIL